MFSLAWGHADTMGGFLFHVGASLVAFIMGYFLMKWYERGKKAE